MDTSVSKHEQDRLAKLLTVGVISGIIAAAINICYMYLYESATGYSNEQYINELNVAIASIVPAVFCGFLYFALRRINFKNSLNLFLIIVVAASLLSFYGPLNSNLPDGSPMPEAFAGLTIPMHIFAPIIYLSMIIRSVSIPQKN